MPSIARRTGASAGAEPRTGLGTVSCMNRVARYADARLGRGQRRKIESEAVDGRSHGAQSRRLALKLIEKRIGLREEGSVPVERRKIVPFPWRIDLAKN